MIRVGVNGAAGRMGRMILGLLAENEPFKTKCVLGGAYEHAGSPFVGKNVGEVVNAYASYKHPIEALSSNSLINCDVLIDFSSPDGARASLDAALTSKKSLVIGTTAVGSLLEKEIKAASAQIPIIFSPNMSVGANFLFELAYLCAKSLGGYDIEIIEAHHRHKKDAPSGTAKKAALEICRAKGWDLDKVAKYGREGVSGERPVDELGIHVVRAGSIIGDHSISFSANGETLTVSHSAQNREPFAKGALVAAVALAENAKGRPGMYTMKDVFEWERR